MYALNLMMCQPVWWPWCKGIVAVIMWRGSCTLWLHQGLESIYRNTSFGKISLNLESVRLAVSMVISICRAPQQHTNFRVIRKLNTDLMPSRSYNKTSYALFKWPGRKLGWLACLQWHRHDCGFQEGHYIMADVKLKVTDAQGPNML